MKDSVFTPEQRERQNACNRAFDHWHKRRRYIDRDQARQAYEAGWDDSAFTRMTKAEEELRKIRAGHTITVEYDMSPHMVEKILRQKLIDLGWTPPQVPLATE